MRELENATGKSISLQIFSDKSYRICDEEANILLNSDDYDTSSDINDLPYDDIQDIAKAIDTIELESTDASQVT